MFLIFAPSHALGYIRNIKVPYSSESAAFHPFPAEIENIGVP